MQAAREEELSPSQRAFGEPITDCCSGLFSDLELDRPTGFPLDHRGTILHPASDAHIVHPQSHEVAAPQLAVDGKIEEREITSTPLQVEAGRGSSKPPSA